MTYFMKKMVVLLLFSMLAVSAAGCGSKQSSADDAAKQESSAADESRQDETASGKFETENVKRIDALYSEDDIDLIRSIQGHITHIDSGGTFPVILAGQKVYAEDYGALKERVSLPETPDDILYFDNISIGENLLYFKDGKVSLYPFKEYGVRFSDLAFNKETDFVGEIGTSSYYNIVRRENEGYVIDYYEDKDGSDTFVLGGQKPLECFRSFRRQRVSYLTDL